MTAPASLSASLIVRNEASEILACLDSLAGEGQPDQIIIVDTGSTDATLDLIRNWAADHLDILVITREIEWPDDFAAARNVAAGMCSTDWILSLDADCRIVPGGMPIIRAACDRARGRTLKLWQAPANGSAQRNDRIWLYKAGVPWRGIVHECIAHDDGEWADPDRTLMTYGWSDSHAHDPGRNLRLLEKAWATEPSGRIAYYLGAEHMDHGRPAEAEPWFQKCLELSHFTGERADALLYLAKIAWRDNRGSEARRHCLMSLGHVPDCREALELMAEMSFPEVAPAWRRYAEVAKNIGVLFVRSPCRS